MEDFEDLMKTIISGKPAKKPKKKKRKKKKDKKQDSWKDPPSMAANQDQPLDKRKNPIKQAPTTDPKPSPIGEFKKPFRESSLIDTWNSKKKKKLRKKRKVKNLEDYAEIGIQRSGTRRIEKKKRSSTRINQKSNDKQIKRMKKYYKKWKNEPNAKGDFMEYFQAQMYQRPQSKAAKMVLKQKQGLKLEAEFPKQGTRLKAGSRLGQRVTRGSNNSRDLSSCHNNKNTYNKKYQFSEDRLSLTNHNPSLEIENLNNESLGHKNITFAGYKNSRNSIYQSFHEDNRNPSSFREPKSEISAKLASQTEYKKLMKFHEENKHRLEKNYEKALGKKGFSSDSGADSDSESGICFADLEAEDMYSTRMGQLEDMIELDKIRKRAIEQKR